MKAFCELLDRLYFTSSTNAKSLLLQDYLRTTADPERGWALAIVAGTLETKLFTRSQLKDLMAERVDPELFAISYDYVGEMSETIAHMWPDSPQKAESGLPSLTELLDEFSSRSKSDKAEYLAGLLEHMTASQRWALLKIGTGGLRIGMSTRLVKRTLAEYGNVSIEQIEGVWHGLKAPYTELFDWLEGHTDKPDVSDRVVFHPLMLSHPIEQGELQSIVPDEWQAEWKYDGIRTQLVSRSTGKALFSRTGDDISHSFPDLLQDIEINAVIDGELMVYRNGKFGSFNELQQRLNKKKPSKKLQQTYPVAIVAYDALSIDGEDLTSLSLVERQSRLFSMLAQQKHGQIIPSPSIDFDDMDELAKLRQQASDDSNGNIEGLMLKRRASTYIPGRPKGNWYKWKRDAKVIDTVMMYAQRGHGKRSSYYSDYTFGLWDGNQLLPVGKAYSGFSDEELKKLDRWVRNHAVGRFGPVREVEKALVVELAFDSVHYSKRHKSGVAMRFPRVHRIRWDKPAAEADQLDTLKKMIL
ncbi:cisplatin damage response ATP-dependent DNA ligase [Aestuariibacter salexigens]|uniref:cisplatin damage response ATP-dependent DNA ligase n=1 Tax=Aestuariibacter salexigens TaxID=226010 RepID=UPI000408C35E|nr:cisplatin damage response ATP-dependent DNA ligase [Aestuariibacter salexigens]